VGSAICRAAHPNLALHHHHHHHHHLASPTTMATRKEKLRACLRCQFVQSPRDFHLKGCPNCEPVLEVSAAMLVAPCGPGVHSTTFLLFTLCRQQMQGSQDRVAECTTSNFDGMISMLRPDESWVAKWQRIGEFLPPPTHTQSMLIHPHFAHPSRLLILLACSSFSLAHPSRLLACSLAYCTEKRLPGLYAVKVVGRLPEGLES